MNKKKKRVYIDMDGVLCNFVKKKENTPQELLDEYKEPERIPGFFKDLEFIDGAKEAVIVLDKYFDLYILSTGSWNNPASLSDKMTWIFNNFGQNKDSIFYHKVIFSHQKYLLRGSYLIDDRTIRNATDFLGKFIHFGTDEFPNWGTVTDYLLKANKIKTTI